MTEYQINCTKCGEQNSVVVIDDVDDIPEEELTRLRKYVEWLYSSQMYEDKWNDNTWMEAQILSVYRDMLADEEYARDTRLFMDEIYGTRWMNGPTAKERLGMGYHMGKEQLVHYYINRYKQEKPNFIHEISTTRLVDEVHDV